MTTALNILMLGGGGREHALAWKIAQSPLTKRLVCAPGNPGMAEVAECLDLKADDLNGVLAYAQKHNIDMVVVGPEAPLADGMADALMRAGIACFGPSQAAAQLETSKAFTKAFCQRHDIPTAAYGVFETALEAETFLTTLQAPYVIKADGLAAGKGVVIAENLDEAKAAVNDMLGGRFGQAGHRVVIEEFMPGEEASVFALLDGETAVLFGGAQDHKRVGEGDTGPNTGGMGTYSPAPILTPQMMQQVQETIITPTVRGMAAEGHPYRGVLYAGLMIHEGQAKLVEFNVRFGDPEAQVLMLRLASDIVPYLLASATGTLGDMPAPSWHDQAAICVVYAAEGYPGTPKKGGVISNLEAATRDGTIVFHAGTKVVDGQLQANGGRVLNVCALGDDLQGAADRAYGACAAIDWPDGFYRKDIGWRALKTPEQA